MKTQTILEGIANDYCDNLGGPGEEPAKEIDYKSAFREAYIYMVNARLHMQMFPSCQVIKEDYEEAKKAAKKAKWEMLSPEMRQR